MICVFPVCQKDLHLLFDLILWIKQLGGCKGHDAILCVDGAIPFDRLNSAIGALRESFDEVQLITNGEPVAGWIPGSNSLWRAASDHCCANRLSPWLFMEPDSTPIKEGWLTALQKEWEAYPLKPAIMGYTYPSNDLKFPPTMISGVAVYDAIDFSGADLSYEAFDVVMSRNVKAVAHTNLIHHFWGQPGLPPTFRQERTPGCPVNTFTMADIKPDAVLFHRCKDGSLMRLLRKRAGVKMIDRHPVITVLPVCNKDAELMIKCLEWMLELDGNNGCDALISYDTSLLSSLRNRVFKTAAAAFANVATYEYPRPILETWPDACNWAFQYTAKHINSKIRRPWFWMEADSTPLKAGWLRTILDDYLASGKPVYGPVVHPPGHINGTAIYPADFAEIAPHAMGAVNLAWDTEMTPDIQEISHDGSRLMQHAWGMVEGRLDETTGPSPHFAATELVGQWIRPDAVWFHRCKDGSLIDRLREIRNGAPRR